MRRYLVERIVSAAFVLVGVSFIVFVLSRLVPGDPAQVMLGPLATPGELAALREQFGLDRPIPVQYGRWLSHVAQGDLGRSIMLHRAVLPEIWERFCATAILAAGGMLLACPPGHPGRPPGASRAAGHHIGAGPAGRRVAADALQHAGRLGPGLRANGAGQGRIR